MDVRKAREAAGLSQVELARRSGVPQPNLSAYENGRRRPGPEVVARLERALEVDPADRVRAHRAAISAVVAQHRASRPRVVGSVARGDSGPGSDLDLLVEFDDDASLLDEVGLRLDLIRLLGVEVDVIALDAVSGALRDRLLAEAIAL